MGVIDLLLEQREKNADGDAAGRANPVVVKRQLEEVRELLPQWITESSSRKKR